MKNDNEIMEVEVLPAEEKSTEKKILGMKPETAEVAGIAGGVGAVTGAGITVMILKRKEIKQWALSENRPWVKWARKISKKADENYTEMMSEDEITSTIESGDAE